MRSSVRTSFSRVITHFFKQKNPYSLRQEVAVILIFYVLAVTLRVLAVRGGNFPFWFDSARDAIVSREIIANRDFKIQGPNASGTQDTVYHGVLYYYIIGPLYWLFTGNPQAVLNVLIILSATAVIPIYFLSKDLVNQKVGVLTLLLYVTSYDALRSATWVANPIIAAVSLPWFFYVFWRVFFKKKQKLLPWLMLAMGVTHQAVILFAPLWGVVLTGFFWNWQQKGRAKILWQPGNLIKGALVYLLTISTMILAQFKLWRAGIFNPFSLSTYASGGQLGIPDIIRGFYLFTDKFTQALFPAFPLVAFVMFWFVFKTLRQKFTKRQRFFLVLMLSWPLWLISWHFKTMYHTLLGLESLLVMILAVWMWELRRSTPGRIVMGAVVLFYLVSSLRMWQIESTAGVSKYFLPEGTYYRDVMALVDYTYETAQGQPFSITAVTNPLGYHALWAHVYWWYGQKKYGYVPEWAGPDQTGLFGADLLPQVTKPRSYHFDIADPPPGISDFFYNRHWDEQQVFAGTSSAVLYFGKARVDYHEPAKWGIVGE